jgi:hypothetical protein
LGNYDYVTISTVDSINGIQAEHRAASGDTLRISPQVVFGGDQNKDDFLYTWYYREGSDAVYDGEWKVLQEGLDLEVEVADPIGTPAQKYTLAFEMLNKTTNIAYRKVFRLSVESPYARGFALLCEQENGFDIDMIALTPDAKLVKYKNILETVGSTLPREGVKPYDILAYTDRFAPNPFAVSGGYSLFVLTDQYTTRLNMHDYSWQPSYDVSNIVEKGSYLDQEYVKQGKPIVAQKMVYGGYNNAMRMYMYHEEPDGRGNWYFYTDYMALTLFSVQMNGVRTTDLTTTGKRFESAPYLAAVSGGAMYFNTDENRFMFGTLTNTNTYYSARTYYAEPISNEPDNALFKFNDPNEGLLHMAAIAHEGGVLRRGYAILKQADGSFKYIEFGSTDNMSIWSNPAANVRYRYSVIPANSNIANAKFFARPDEAANSPFLYYVTDDNRVMKADISAPAAIVTDITPLVLKDDGYNEITLFKYTLPESSTLEGTAKSALAVGTYNASLGKNEGGKLEFFLPSSTITGNLAVARYPDAPAAEEGYQIEMSWTGLGRIVGLSYKQK